MIGVHGVEYVISRNFGTDGNIVNHLNPRERNIAMVFLELRALSAYDRGDDIGFNLKISGLNRREIDKKVKDVAKLHEVDALLHRKPGQRSQVLRH